MIYVSEETLDALVRIVNRMAAGDSLARAVWQEAGRYCDPCAAEAELRQRLSAVGVAFPPEVPDPDPKGTAPGGHRGISSGGVSSGGDGRWRAGGTHTAKGGG